MRRIIGLSMSALLAATLAVVVGPAPAWAAAPGALLSSEPLPASMWLPGTGAAYRMTYATTGPNGSAATSSGVLLVPAGTPPAGGWPVLSWAHGTVGVGDSCAPSTNGLGDVAGLTAWLGQGYAIAATDYIGLGTPGVHPYLDGRSEANAVVDAVRAARSIDATLAKKWVVVGQSQGGQAALFTDRYAPAYAPELDFRGAVATGPPSHIELLLSGVAGLPLPAVLPAGMMAFISYMLAGVQATGFPIENYLTATGLSVLADAKQLCLGAMTTRMSGVGLGDLFAKGCDAPCSAAFTAMMGVPVSGYPRPFFIGQGLIDTTVPAPLTVLLVTELTLNLQPFTFRAYPTDHGGTVTASLPDSEPFVKARFAGAPAPALPLLGDVSVNTLTNALGLPSLGLGG